MSSAPQVSAVLLCYNCEAFVAEAVESALSQDCEPIEIVSPFQMDQYRISKALPPEDQRIMIEARPGGQIAFALVTLYVNGSPLQTFDQAPYRLWWQLQPGTHEIYAVGETADGQSYASEPITLIVRG